MRISSYYQFQRQSSYISKQYGQMTTLQAQASTGLKIQHSSEDPVLAGQLKSIQTYMDTLDTYKDNVTQAGTRTKLLADRIGGALSSDGVINDISKVNTLISQAINANGKGGSDALKNLASSLQGILGSLLNAANAQDPLGGGYIFSGYQTQTAPYVLSSGRYEYQGGTESSEIQIGDNVSTTYNESGHKVFGDIFQGNGSFTVAAGSGNTGGAAVTDPGSVNSATYVPDVYTVTFVTNGSGELAYQVVGATSGQVIPALPATIPANAPKYVSGTPISFNGVNINIGDVNNPPKAGDTFTIQPAAKENIFNTLQDLINNLKDGNLNSAQIHQVLVQAGGAFSLAGAHLIAYQSELSSREVAVNQQETTNKTLYDSQDQLLNGLRSADYPSVISQLFTTKTTLSTAMDTYKLFMQTLSDIIKI